MFEKTVCLYTVTNDGLGYVFTIRRGDKEIAEGMTYDGYDGLVKIARKLAKRRIKTFKMIN